MRCSSRPSTPGIARSSTRHAHDARSKPLEERLRRFEGDDVRAGGRQEARERLAHVLVVVNHVYDRGRRHRSSPRAGQAFRSARLRHRPDCWSPRSSRRARRRSFGRWRDRVPTPWRLVVTNGSKMLSSSAGAIPGPRSATVTSTLPDDVRRVRTRSRRGPFASSIASQPFITAIEHHLRKLHAVGGDQRQARFVVGDHLDAPVHKIAVQEMQRILHHLVHVDRPMLRILLLEERPQALDHRGRAPIVLHDVVDDLRDLVEPRRRLREESLRSLGVAQDRRQRLIELVGERSRQRTQHAHPRQMRHFVALARRRSLDAPAFRHVDDGHEHERTVLGLHRIEADLDRNFAAVLAASEELAAGTHAPRLRVPHVFATITLMRTPRPRWHEVFDLPAHELFRRIAEHRAHLCVRERDRAVPVDEQDRGGHRLHDGAKARLAAREAASTIAPRR